MIKIHFINLRIEIIGMNMPSRNYLSRNKNLKRVSLHMTTNTDSNE